MGMQRCRKAAPQACEFSMDPGFRRDDGFDVNGKNVYIV
jgi:hypothetical protein